MPLKAPNLRGDRSTLDSTGLETLPKTKPESLKPSEPCPVPNEILERVNREVVRMTNARNRIQRLLEASRQPKRCDEHLDDAGHNTEHGDTHEAESPATTSSQETTNAL